MSNVKEIMNQISFSECKVYKKASVILCKRYCLRNFMKQLFPLQEFSRQVFAPDEAVVFRGAATEVEKNRKDVNLFIVINLILPLCG